MRRLHWQCLVEGIEDTPLPPASRNNKGNHSLKTTFRNEKEFTTPKSSEKKDFFFGGGGVKC